VSDGGNLQLAAGASLDFFVLPGDVNRDRSIDFNDLVLLAQRYNSSPPAAAASSTPPALPAAAPTFQTTAATTTPASIFNTTTRVRPHTLAKPPTRRPTAQ
jgi:hypothetical protein